MVDRSKVEEVLARYDDAASESRWRDGSLGAVLIAAARAVVEAPEVWFCLEHRAEEAADEEIGVCWAYAGSEPCRMVRVFLVPAEEESV
jgi:hypothetical protein